MNYATENPGAIVKVSKWVRNSEAVKYQRAVNLNSPQGPETTYLVKSSYYYCFKSNVKTSLFKTFSS